MAINTLRTNYENEAGQNSSSFEIANGDLEALEEITAAYGLKDNSKVIAFAIGLLKEANGGPVAVVKDDGRVNKYLPAEALKTNGSNK